jgi:hypothetical protein
MAAANDDNVESVLLGFDHGAVLAEARVRVKNIAFAGMFHVKHRQSGSKIPLF